MNPIYSKSKVCFFFQDVSISLRKRTELKKYIGSVFQANKKKLESLNYIFCTDKALLAINCDYLGHDYYTDIITFDLSESSATTADIYISIDRVRENAKTFGVSFKSEIHRVIFHGALHLCGLNDKTKKGRLEMRAAENHLIDKYLT